MTSGSIEYAYARLAARHGRRADEATWRRIESPRSLAALIDVVHATALDRWIAGIAPQSDAHAIDARLRDRWRAYVHEVAGWMPERWQPAVAWWATLPDLPIVAHLAAGGAALPWMTLDPVCRRWIERDVRPAHPLRALRPGVPVETAWRDEWTRRLPRGDPGPLGELEHVVDAHLRAFRALPPGDGTALRQSLKPVLVALWRRAVATPAAAFIALALTLLDVERLRGELLRRAALPARRLAP